MRSADFELIEHLPFTTGEDLGRRARVGVVALSSDYTIEHELGRLLDLPGVGVYTARLPNSPEVTPETLAAMQDHIADTAARILMGDRLDVVAFGCTSATAVLGEKKVAELIQSAKPDAQTATPLSAALAAMTALKARRVAVLTPYRSDVNDTLRQRLTEGGLEIPVFGSFNEPQDPIVAAIDEKSLASAVRKLIDGRDLDAVFVSCTSIRFAEAIPSLEAEIGLPVTTSNHALAWRCLRLANVHDKTPEKGRLYAL